MNTKNQHRLGLRRGRKVRFQYRKLFRSGLRFTGFALVLLTLYYLLRALIPGLAGLLDALFAGLLERLGKDLGADED